MLAKLLPLVLAWTPTFYPPGAGPETPEARTQRWAMVSDTIVQVAGAGVTELHPVDNAALVATIFLHESSLDYHVHGGETSPISHQDHGKARCLGQIQQSRLHTRAEWLALSGRGRLATTRCAAAVLTIIHYHVKRCRLRNDIPEPYRWRGRLSSHEAYVLFTAYWKGITCKPQPQMSGRLKTWARIRRALS